MKVLMIEDDVAYAKLISSELSARVGFEVVVAADPLRARELLMAQSFDVVVVDMRFAPLANHYAARRRRGEISVHRDNQFLVSGLAAMLDVVTVARRAPQGTQRPRIVVWTIPEASRVLQMIFAYEVIRARAFCAKGGDIGALVNAIERAASGVSQVDTALNAYLPIKGSPPLAESLFSAPSWRSIWRALALGISDRSEIRRATFLGQGTVNNNLPRMHQRLKEFDPGLPPDREPLQQLVAYADLNWEFFLDDAVMRQFPPAEARGIRIGP